MALLAHQKLTWVLPGQPFGTGKDGDYSSATAPTLTKDSISGTSGSPTLTTAGSTFANGDILLLHQSRGTGVGQYEYAKVVSGGGTTTLTLSKNLVYTYTDSGASQAQAIKIPQYKDVTIQSGTWSPAAWDGNTGGILIFAASGVLTPTGTISVNSLGYAGGLQYQCTTNSATAYAGEGTAAASFRNDSSSTAANGNGGGPGMRGATGYNDGPGGGGGNGTAGTGNLQDASRDGDGGNTSGDLNLQNITFGGGGGGGVFDNTGGTGYGGNGGTGAGIVIIHAKRILTVNSITANGANGQNWSGTAGNTGGGGAAGGSILILTEMGDIGTDKLSTTGGSGGTSRNGQVAGVGGKGRIAIYYGVSLSGSVGGSYYGSYNAERDTDLITGSGAAFALFV